MSYQFRLGAQYGFDSLYGENQFSIGDEYTVRGFKGGAGSGDRGFYISQTVTILFTLKRVIYLTLTLFWVLI